MSKDCIRDRCVEAGERPSLLDDHVSDRSPRVVDFAHAASANRMARHGTLYFVGRGGVGLLTMATLAVFTRMLAPADYGRYALGVTVASIASALFFQWLNVGVGRFYPVFLDRPGVLVAATWRGLSISTLTAFAAFLAAIPFAQTFGVSFVFLLSVLLATVGFGIYNLFLQVVNSQGKPLCFALFGWIRGVSTLAAGAGFMLLGTAYLGALFGVVGGLVVSTLLGNPFRGVRPIDSAEARDLSRTLLRYGMPLMLTFLGGVAVEFADRLLIAWLLGTGQVGHYAAAYDLTSQSLSALTNVLFLAAFPAVIHAFEHEGEDAARDHMRSLGRSLVVVALPASVGFLAVSRDVAHLLLGESFRDVGAGIMPIIAIAVWLGGFKSFYLDVVFQIRRLPGYQAAIALSMMVVNVALNLLFLSSYGIVAAAWATLAAFALGVVLSFFFGRRLMRLQSLRGDFLKTAAASALMAAVICCLPEGHGVTLLLAKIALGCVVYLVAAWTLDIAEARERLLRCLNTRRRGSIPPC